MATFRNLRAIMVIIIDLLYKALALRKVLRTVHYRNVRTVDNTASVIGSVTNNLVLSIPRSSQPILRIIMAFIAYI